MEETLGKRIVAHRKRLGLTQDRLAELLGVTAQAVSKWENDQSCPDITMLPKLAQTFGVSVDELLGMERKPLPAEVSGQPEGSDDAQVQEGAWELQWDGGRKTSAGFALWVLLLGGLLLLANLQERYVFWDLIWMTGLLVFGLFGLYPKFSFFRLGCALFGGCFLLNLFELLPFHLGKQLLLPFFLLLFGLSLLVDALRKPKKGSFHVKRSGKVPGVPLVYHGQQFSCETSFGENSCLIQMPRMSGGSAKVSFGELTVDLRGCETITNGSVLSLDCSFGELTLLVPRHCRVEPASETAFASVDVEGSPASDADITLCLRCHVSFGQITLRYV